MALVLDELDDLPVVDHRYRLWPWSLRALARRRGTSPGTVHKHVRALRDAGVLVEDERQQGRLLVDTAHLEDGGSAVAMLGRASSPPVAAGMDVVAGDSADHLVGAIEALTSVAEVRPDLADDLVDIIGRLVQLLVNTGSTTLTARGRAPNPTTARDCAPSSVERKRDLGRSSNSLSVHRARGARPAEARARHGEVSDRTPERLFELLAPLDPGHHVTYTEGVLAALAPYDDDQVRYAAARAAASPAANPVGLLVDRANRHDPAFFPPSGLQDAKAPAAMHGHDCRCAGVGVVPVDADPNTYRPCPGIPTELLAG